MNSTESPFLQGFNLEISVWWHIRLIHLDFKILLRNEYWEVPMHIKAKKTITWTWFSSSSFKCKSRNIMDLVLKICSQINTSPPANIHGRCFRCLRHLQTHLVLQCVQVPTSVWRLWQLLYIWQGLCNSWQIYIVSMFKCLHWGLYSLRNDLTSNCRYLALHARAGDRYTCQR